MKRKTKQKLPVSMPPNIWNISSVNETNCFDSSFYVNLEHSSFPHICRNVHTAMGTRFSNEIPFAMFLHVMSGYLSANLIVIMNENGIYIGGKHIEDVEYYEGISKIEVPKPIYEYVAAIGKITLDSGATIYHNLPEIAIPDDGSKFIAGTFGQINEKTHNVYECYISPYVTKQLIQETIKANDEQHWDGSWNPLPPGYIPPNAVATEYLLGYLMPEKISQEALGVLQCLQIPADDRKRLYLSYDMIQKFRNSLNSCRTRCRINTKSFPCDASEIKHKEMLARATLGFLRINETVSNGQLIERSPAELLSPVPLSPQNSAKALIFGLRCERTTEAPRPCLFVDGVEPSGWNETRNHNFLCVGLFTSQPAPLRQSLSEPRHRGCFNIQRQRLIRNFAQQSLDEKFGHINSFDGVYSTIPHFHALCVNLEHSSFVKICKDVHSCTSFRFQRRFPYALFLHIMTCYLHANLLMRESENSFSNIITRDEYHYLMEDIRSVPMPIYEYVAAIGRIKLDSGETIYHNLPKIAIPAIPDDGSNHEAGTFGPVDETTHNVYECYISPYVTKQFILETIKASDDKQGNCNNSTTTPWNPLPPGYIPQNATATEYLLGYSDTLQTFNEPVLTYLKHVQFSTQGVKARLCWPELSSFRYLFNYIGYKMNPAKIERNVTKDVSTLGFWSGVQVYNSELFSPVHLNKESSTKASVFGMRRERTPAESGPCCKVNGSEPSGWNETRNDNFLCKGKFSPTDGKHFLGSFNEMREVSRAEPDMSRSSFVQKFQEVNDNNSLSDSD